MGIIGQWPLQHVITLDQMKRQSNIVCYYFVDEDRIISHEREMELEKDGYIPDHDNLTIMSETMKSYISSFEKQSISPIISPALQRIIVSNVNPRILTESVKIQNSSAVLILRDQDKGVMEDIGAIWNSSLSMYTINIECLKTLREKKRQRSNGKIQIVQDRGGIIVEVHGDVSKHVPLLKEIGGKYDENRDIWIVPMSVAHKILHLKQ